MKGNFIAFGRYALQALESARISARQIEAGRRAMARIGRREGKTWVRIIPDKPVRVKAAGVRMGRGVGAVAYMAAEVKPGRILFEIGGVPESRAREAIAVAASKMPIRTQFKQVK